MVSTTKRCFLVHYDSMNAKIRILFVLSAVVFILPLLGIPRNTKDILLYAIGALLIVLGFFIKRSIKTLRLRLKRLEGQQGTLIQ